MPSSRPISAASWGIIIALSVIWGSAFYLIVIILRDIPPNTMVLLRLALAVPPLVFWLKLSGGTLPLDGRSLRQYAIIGALNVALPFILFAYAQVHITSSVAAVLNATTPLWGVVVAHIFTSDEKATLGKALGVVIGFAGVWVMLGADFDSGSREAISGQVACIIATLGYALASVYGRRLGDRGLQPMQIATGQVAAAALMMIPIVLFTETPWNAPMPGVPAISALLGLAFVSTGLAYVLYFRLLADVGAANSLIITFLIPVTAIILGSAFLGEEVTARQAGGIALILLGLVALDGRVFVKLAPTRSVL